MSIVADSLTLRAVADSLHRIHVADSLHQIHVADSLHQIHVADSLHRVYVADSIALAREQARDYIFGETSTICEAIPPKINESLVGVESLISNPIYIILAAAFALLYLLWLPHIIRSGGVKVSRLGHSKRSRIVEGRDWGAPQRLGPIVVTWLLKVAVVSLMASRAIAQIWDSEAEFSGAVWVIGGVAVVALMALYRWSIVKVAGYLTLQSEFVNKLLTMKSQLSIWTVLIISPLFVMCCLTDYVDGVWILQLSMIVVVAFLLIYLRQSFLLFMKQNISILHWFLYLCGVEILPLTFLWAIVTRQMLI